ncbi:glycosyltransferase [Erwinia mallotivora]|uniref:Glycosyltransferase n=1 Tax=Erwinia mallotivora TaxID=69222 RepID=A0A014NQS7_9GAMM|nr:glycosyltransferase [Erwinia mallotivora]EXU76185.1 glycosyltransferase [Erwinia mallotivora]
MNTVYGLVQKPTLSVIMPVYNGRRYLAEALDSLLKQTSAPEEIIIIDDGSTDGTDQLIEDYCQRYGHIRLLRNTHAGVSAARNKGLEVASGDFIYFMDADDLVAPTLFADFIREKRVCPQLELYGFSAEMFPDVPAEQRKYTRTHTRAMQGEFAGGSEMLRKLIASNSAHRVLWSSVISRELIDRTHSAFLPVQNHEDAPFMFTLYLQASRVFFTATAYYFKRYTQSSLSVSTRDFSWVKNYFIVREGTENALRAAGLPLDSKLLDSYYFPVMSGCLMMVRKHRMVVPKEYQLPLNTLARQITRHSLRMSLVWYCHPLYSGLTWFRKKLSGFSA